MAPTAAANSSNSSSSCPPGRFLYFSPTTGLLGCALCQQMGVFCPGDDLQHLCRKPTAATWLTPPPAAIPAAGYTSAAQCALACTDPAEYRPPCRAPPCVAGGKVPARKLL